MKKYLVLLLMVASLFVIPFKVEAGYKTVLGDDYETKNLKETLESEEMQLSGNYSESDKQVTIYLFRGQGCSFCRAFLTYINSIVPEYGKYFKLVSFEVWNNEQNWYLLNQTSYFLDKQLAQGVPYIIIGEKVFGGYSEEYNEDIVKAIKTLYDTPKADRYDVFEKAAEGGFPTKDEIIQISNELNGEKEGENYSQSSGTDTKSNLLIILCTLGFVAAGTVAVILYERSRFNRLEYLLRKSATAKVEPKSKKK